MKPSLLPPVIYLLVALLAALPVTAKEAAPVVSPSVTQGGLTCFTIKPTAKEKEPPSCDSLCGERKAACTGVTNGAMNPPTACGDPAPPNFALCRCCKAGGQ